MSLLVSHYLHLSSKVLRIPPFIIPNSKFIIIHPAIFVTALSTKASSGKCFNGKKTGQDIKNEPAFFISASYLQF